MRDLFLEPHREHCALTLISSLICCFNQNSTLCLWPHRVKCDDACLILCVPVAFNTSSVKQYTVRSQNKLILSKALTSPANIFTHWNFLQSYSETQDTCIRAERQGVSIKEERKRSLHFKSPD